MLFINKASIRAISFQKIVDRNINSIGYETLVRLKGVPDRLTSAAISELSENELCRLTSNLLFRLRLACISDISEKKSVKRIFVNVEKSTLSCSESIDELLECAVDFVSSGFELVVEVTERPLASTCSMRDYIDGLIRLSRAGVAIALDDYNIAGNCHIELEMGLVELVKVDIESHGMPLSPGYTLMRENLRDFHSIVSNFTNDFRIPLLAERVENSWQFETLCSMRFDYFQGYFTGRPQLFAEGLNVD